MASPNRRPPRISARMRSLSLNVTVLIACLMSLYPFVIMFFGSLKGAGEISTNAGGVPRAPTLANYTSLVTGPTGRVVWRGIANSFIVTIPSTILTVLFAAMAGYAFARYHFRGKNLLFGFLIASMLVPIEVNIPTLYLMFSKIGWLNSYQALILPGSASVLYLFMARQFMAGLPGEVFEAARVDGAGHARVMFQIAFPMSAPLLGAISVLAFVAKWSEYVWPRIANNDPAFQPIMVLLPSLSTSASSFIIRPETLMAGAVIITIPLVIVFLLFQDKLMNGVTVGAVRG